MTENHKPKLSDKELLNYAIENGMIDVNIIKSQIEMKEYQDYLAKHDSRIWQSTDGNWYTYLPDKKRRLIKRKTKDNLENAIVDFYKSKEEEPYMEEVFDAWVTKKLEYGEIQRQSYDRYRNDYKLFFYGKRINEIKIKYITEDMLEDFVKSTIHDMKLTAKVWSRCRTLIYGIFKYAKKKGYTDISITHFMGDLELSRRIFQHKVRKSEEEVFTDEEVMKITEYVRAKKPSITELGVLLSFETGMRIGELAALQWCDVNGFLLSINKREIRYNDENGKSVIEVVENAKTEAGTREIILSQNAQRILKELRSANPFGEYIFMNDGKRIWANTFSKRLVAICKKVGIKPRTEHKARKTYATKLIDAGLNDRLITQQMGHTEIETTRKHYYFNNKTLDVSREMIENAIKYG